MPNYCENTLTIKGEEKDLEEFKAKGRSKDKVLKISNFFPIPIGIRYLKSEDDLTKGEKKKLIKKYGTISEQDWCVKHWGTKWDLCDPILSEDEEYELVYCFDTAWSPPIEAFAEISKKYEDLSFILEYKETGAGFQGITRIMRGDVDDHYINI